jgi:hypothetical protein
MKFFAFLFSAIFRIADGSPTVYLNMQQMDPKALYYFMLSMKICIGVTVDG